MVYGDNDLVIVLDLTVQTEKEGEEGVDVATVVFQIVVKDLLKHKGKGVKGILSLERHNKLIDISVRAENGGGFPSGIVLGKVHKESCHGG